MLDVDLEFAGENAAFFGSSAEFEEIEGGLDAAIEQELEIFGGESGELLD